MAPAAAPVLPPQTCTPCGALADITTEYQRADHSTHGAYSGPCYRTFTRPFSTLSSAGRYHYEAQHDQH